MEARYGSKYYRCRRHRLLVGRQWMRYLTRKIEYQRNRLPRYLHDMACTCTVGIACLNQEGNSGKYISIDLECLRDELNDHQDGIQKYAVICDRVYRGVCAVVCDHQHIRKNHP